MTETNDSVVKFSDFGLNVRLEKSISNVGWQIPTLVQEKAIRFGLEGKDLLIKGRTGCGKTGAFLIPILHNLI
jgi:ATP-dependent RNA helicase DDX56/DBP9